MATVEFPEDSSGLVETIVRSAITQFAQELPATPFYFNDPNEQRKLRASGVCFLSAKRSAAIPIGNSEWVVFAVAPEVKFTHKLEEDPDISVFGTSYHSGAIVMFKQLPPDREVYFESALFALKKPPVSINLELSFKVWGGHNDFRVRCNYVVYQEALE